MVTIIYRYRLRCITENTDVETWDTEAPTVCPHGVDHEIDPASVAIIENVRTESLKDEDGAPYVKPKAAPKGWHYEIRLLQLKTSEAGSLKNLTVWGADRGDALVRFYELVSGTYTEITGANASDQAYLDSNCVATAVDLEPPYDYEAVGGIARIAEDPTTDVWLGAILAPNIPVELGGQVVFVSGANFRFIKSNGQIEADGRASQRANYQSGGYPGTNLLRIVVRHGAGEKHEVTFALEHYHA